MREKLLAKLREQKEVLEHNITRIGADNRFIFERDYYTLAGQHYIITSLIDAILEGQFGDD